MHKGLTEDSLSTVFLLPVHSILMIVCRLRILNINTVGVTVTSITDYLLFPIKTLAYGIKTNPLSFSVHCEFVGVIFVFSFLILFQNLYNKYWKSYRAVVPLRPLHTCGSHNYISPSRLTVCLTLWSGLLKGCFEKWPSGFFRTLRGTDGSLCVPVVLHYMSHSLGLQSSPTVTVCCLSSKSAECISLVNRMAFRKLGLQNERHGSRHLCVSFCLHARCYCC